MIKRSSTGRVMVNLTNQNNIEDSDKMIELSVMDERYRDEDFKFVVNTKFRSLQNAVSAEGYVLNKYKTLVRNLSDGVVSPETSNLTSVDQFFSNIANLINLNSDSEIAQKEKIKLLEETVDEVNSISKEKENLIYIQANEIFEKDVVISEKEREIELLKDTINSLLTIPRSNE